MKFLALALLLAAAAPSCSLVTVPVKTAGSIVNTTVKTSGKVVEAPFKAASGGYHSPKASETPAPPEQKTPQP